MANEDSDDEIYEDSSIFYADRPDWKDVTPVEQDDGPNPVVAIAYSDRLGKVHLSDIVGIKQNGRGKQKCECR